MPRLPFALILLLAPGAAAETQLRDVTVGVSAEDGSAVHDLGPEDFTIREDGEVRAVVGLARDQRPIDVALILDSSESMREDYRIRFVPAAMAFASSLPEWARLTVWTSGGRAFRAVDFDDDAVDAKSRLQKVATGGVRFTLHAMIEASNHLDDGPPARRVMVVVTGDQIPYERGTIKDTARVIPETHVTPVVIMVKSGTATRVGGTGISWEVEPFFRDMAKGYGGSLDVVTSALSVEGLLQRIASELTSQYMVRFESESEHPFQPEVEIGREGVRGRAGLAMRAAER